MGTERNKVLLYRTDKSGNTPLASDIEHGEITLNYNSETPFIAFKDTEDNIQKIGTLQDVYTKSEIYNKTEVDELIDGIEHKLTSEYESVEYPTTSTVSFTAATADQTLDEAIHTVETNVSTLVSEVLKDEKVIAAAITEIKESAGFDINLKYVKDSNATYISAATSLSEADSLLDNAIADVNSNITNLSTLVDAFGSNKQLKELDLVRVWTLGSAKDKGKEYLTEEEIAWFDALKAESKEGYAYVGRGEWNTTGTIYEGIENMFFAGDEHDSYIFPSVNVVNDEGMTFCYYDTVNNDVRCYLIDYEYYCVYQMMWNISNDDGLVNTHDFAHHQSTDDKYEVIHAITYDLTNKNLRHELYKTLFIVSDNDCKGCLNGLTKQLTIISYNEFDEIVTFKDFQKNKMYQSTITYNEDKTTATIDNLVEITSDTPNFVLDGDGTKYLSDDGSYKEVQHKLTSEYESVVYPTNTGDKVFTPAAAEQTLDDAIHTVDSNIVTLTNAVLENEEVISAAITTLNESCGFDENGLYVQFTEGKYINSATSLSEATNVLDYTIGNIEEKVDAIEIQTKEVKTKYVYDFTLYGEGDILSDEDATGLINAINNNIPIYAISSLENGMYPVNVIENNINIYTLSFISYVTPQSHFNDAVPSIIFICETINFNTNTVLSLKYFKLEDKFDAKSVIVDLTDSSITEEKYNEMYAAINNNIPINVLIHNEAANNFIGIKQADVTMDPGGNIHLYYTVGDGEHLTTKLCETHINGNNYSVVTETTPINNLKPYIWDGQTISETIYNELLDAALNFRDIIVTTAGYLNYRLIGSTYIASSLCLTFCNTYSSPNFTFMDYYITPNSVEIKQAPIYNKRESNSTNLNTGSYMNPGLISEDTTITYRGTISAANYEGQFHFGDTVYAITFQSGIKWSTDSVLDYKPNHTYQFRIVRGFGVMKEFAN